MVPTLVKVQHTVKTAHLEHIAVTQHHHAQTVQLALTLLSQVQPAHLLASVVKRAHSHMGAHHCVLIAQLVTSH